MNEKIRTWRKDGFKLELFDTFQRDSYGKSILAYKFYDNKELIFEGEDFHASPIHSIDSLHTVYALLGFLSLQPGDIKDDYFDSYTPRQLAWAESNRAEDLNWYVMSWEEKHM